MIDPKTNQEIEYEEWQKIDLPAGLRLDLALGEKIEESRNYIQTLIAEERVLVNGQLKKASYRVREEDCIEINLPEPKALKIEPEDIPLDIVYEDRDLLLVNKPQGMVVHPAPGSLRGTLVNALLHHSPHLSRINGDIRPGIVHRIDKDTSGLLLVAKNDETHLKLTEQFKEQKVKRSYRAIIHGVLSEPSGTIKAPIGRDPKDRKKMAVVFKNGKEAITHYYILKRYPRFTEIKAVLETGRTHQIRVHMAYIKHPLLGDPLYGPRKNLFNLKGQVLHAQTLAFKHPRTGEEMEFSTEVPSWYSEVIAKIEKAG
jgi:23S rRNA pseudouridine1911/1915/1917 synthase